MAKKKFTPRASGSRSAPSAEGKHLVIVESPTKAKTINKYLGPDYVVMASVGHVRDLPKSAPKGAKRSEHPVPGVDLENRFEPTYEILPDKKKTVTELKKAARQAVDVWFATDLDREGEAIAWHLAQALGVEPAQAKRVVFNAITKAEIEQAFASPRPIETNRVDAQQARRIVDRIVGYLVSPLLWRKVAGGLSAGRVQSVATRLVVEREREIDAFVPEEYWKLVALFAADAPQAPALAQAWRQWMATDENTNPRTLKDQNAWLSERQCLRAELIEFGGKKWQPEDREMALEAARQLGFALQERIETDVAGAKGPARHVCQFAGRVYEDAPTYRIIGIQTKRTLSRPSAPFITSTLQQAAANRLGFQLQRTMRIAQQLYEGIDLKGARGQTGLITYMRTDSTHLSREALEMVRGHIGRMYGERYLPGKPNFYSSSNKAAQEAHEAIRPTDVSITPESIRPLLSDEQFKLYDLVWRRFVSCQMTAAEWDATTVEIRPQNVDALLRATGRALAFDGYLKVTGLPKGDELVLPVLQEQQVLGPVDLTPTQHFTAPPARFTEASLQKKLEEEGIGRPSTYAAIISTIQDRKYVEPVAPRDRRLRATDLGMVVTDLLIEAFPVVMDVPYTRNMEAELDQIETDNLDWREMLDRFYNRFRERLDRAYDTLQHAKATSEDAPYPCPVCSAPTVYRFGKNGRFLSCSRFNVPPVEVQVAGHPGVVFQLHQAKGKARPKVISPDGQMKIGWTKLSAEERERFQMLSDQMPEPCAWAAPIDAEGKPMSPEMTDILCPEDGQPMIRRSGRFGPFLASSNYPAVKYIIKLDPKTGAVVLPKPNPMPTDLLCPKCGESTQATLLLRDSKRGLWLSCSRYPKCRGRESFSKLPEEKQQELTAAWEAWLVEHPVPQIRTASGRILQEEDVYIPVVAETDPAATAPA